MLAATSPLTTPLCSMGMLAQPIMVSSWLRTHELRQRAPQGHDDAAVAVVRVHAAAAQLHHALAQAAQAGQVELGVAVGAAHALGLHRCRARR